MTATTELRPRRWLRPAVACLTAGALQACTSDPAAPSLASLQFQVASVLVSGLGVSQQVEVVPLDFRGRRFSGATITWTSSNTAVATVSGSGTTATITSVSEGVATIRATSGTINAQIPVTVQVRVTGVAITGPTEPLPMLEGRQLTAMVEGDPGASRNVTWSTSAPGVATVTPSITESGQPVTVTGISLGSAAIRAAALANSSIAREIVITVTPALVVTVTVTLSNATIRVGQTAQTSVTTRDRNGGELTGRTVSSYGSSNPSVASVNQTGLVTAHAVGSTSISAMVEGVSGTTTLTVLPPVATVTVSPATSAIAPGATVQLTPTLRDAGNNILTGRDVDWATSDASVATVSSSGLVTAAAPGGPVTITATSEGESGSAQVTVCGSGNGLTPPPGVVAEYFVSATQGNNATGNGSCLAPYRTITRALTGAQSGDVVWVAPGTYDVTLGETFPIMLPAGVTVLGDEANRGTGAQATRIIGGGNLGGAILCTVVPPFTYGVTIMPGAGSVVAGFEITNPAGVAARYAVLIRTEHVTVRRNSVVNSGLGIHFCLGGQNHVVSGNVVSGNNSGLNFLDGGGDGLFENNVIVQNSFGVSIGWTNNLDFGGGTLGSVGGNTISCNASNDIFFSPIVMTVSAASNFWDHVPPTTTNGNRDGEDINHQGMATVIATGAMLAAGACP